MSVAKLLAVAGVVFLVGTFPSTARAAEPPAPCATCVALLVSPNDAEAALDAQARMTGVDLVFARDQSPAPALIERLARAGARVWMTKPAGAAADSPPDLSFVTGVFLVPDGLPGGGANETLFAIRRTATALRAVRPELRVGLVLTPALTTLSGAAGVAPVPLTPCGCRPTSQGRRPQWRATMPGWRSGSNAGTRT